MTEGLMYALFGWSLLMNGIALTLIGKREGRRLLMLFGVLHISGGVALVLNGLLAAFVWEHVP